MDGMNEEIKEMNDLEETSLSDEVEEILLNTREQGEMMLQLIENQIKVKDDLINRLHDEVEYYKRGSEEQFVNQIMKAVIKVRKDMLRQLRSPDFNRMTKEDLQREYTYIFEDLSDLLEQQNVDAYTTNPGAEFDASIHQPKIEATQNPSLDKIIKESLAEGYTKNGKVLQPERVVVYSYKA